MQGTRGILFASPDSMLDDSLPVRYYGSEFHTWVSVWFSNEQLRCRQQLAQTRLARKKKKKKKNHWELSGGFSCSVFKSLEWMFSSWSHLVFIAVWKLSTASSAVIQAPLLPGQDSFLLCLLDHLVLCSYK